MIIYIVILDYYNIKKIKWTRHLGVELIFNFNSISTLAQNKFDFSKKEKEKVNVVLNSKPAYELKNEA